MNSRNIRQIHRWLGLIFSISVLMSASSGVIHNIMSRTQSAPPSARPTGTIDPKDIKVSVDQVVKSLPSDFLEIHAVSIRMISGEPWYQFMGRKDQANFYVNAKDGRIGENQDEIYASEIASGYLGGAPVKKKAYLTSFDDEYIAIFRILPVYRFDAEDGKGTRVYVSTMTGSVTRYTNNQRQFEANLFSNLHKLQFIKNKDVRDAVLTLMTFGIFLVAVMGVVLFFVTRPVKKH